MLESVGAGVCTVSVVLPKIPLQVPWIVALPFATAVATPEAEIVATLGAVELHVVEGGHGWLDPSEKRAVAINCRVVPLLIV